ncbi:MAG: galactose-1-phosphate uridylyltransferase [Acidimicrobiales bacterium]|nr:MAG: galactose-1-phosphate uridylyltransferase [Acidimicrobiales bacterium]
MSQLRLNPLTGRWVTVALERAARPFELATQRMPVEVGLDEPCPFCPGNEEAMPPALETYGPGGRWLVRVVPNRYPAFAGDGPFKPERIGLVHTQAAAVGIHEVLVTTPDHHASWADLGDRQTGLVMAAIRDRMEEHASMASVRYTQAIVNHGREAGASREHPHGQLLGIPFVPGELAEELAGFERFDGDCVLCTTIEEECAARLRIVVETERCVLICPFWSGSPYEMLLIPRKHVAHLVDCSPRDLVTCGHVLRDGLRALRSAVGDVAYNLVFHTAPHGERVLYHWHAHVIPRLTSIAGFEQGTGVMINIVSPERSSARLRQALETKP